MLAERCRQRQSERAGRHAETIGERLIADRAVLRDLPVVPLEPCEKRVGRVSSTALVRYRCNDYSVPTAYGFQDVVVKGFVVEGGNRPRAVHRQLKKLGDPKISVTAADAVCAGKGRYGMILWVKPKDYGRAARVLGAK